MENREQEWRSGGEVVTILNMVVWEALTEKVTVLVNIMLADITDNPSNLSGYTQ